MKISALSRIPTLCLVIGIPIVSILASSAMLYLAISSNPPQDVEIIGEQIPLSKTSWRGEQL